MAKHGDTGADCLPLGDLYRTEVRALAREVGVPDDIAERRPQPGLRCGRPDTEELGVAPETLGGILRLGIDEVLNVDVVAD